MFDEVLNTPVNAIVSDFIKMLQQILSWKMETFIAQKMKFSFKDFFCKCDQIPKKLRIWSHLLKKSLMENFIFCAVLHNLIYGSY